MSIKPDISRRTQRAFSLIESIIAIGILGFIGLVILSAIDTNTKTSGTLDEQVTAINVATACIEQLRTAEFSVDYSGISSIITLPSFYNVDFTIECSTDGVEFGTCSGGETLQRITVIVLHGERPVYSTCTFKSAFGE